MFESIAKIRDEKNQKHAQDLLNKGVDFVNSKLFKQAMMAFNESLDIAPDFVSLKLRDHFYDYEKSGNDEAALSVGLCLVKLLPDDYVLACRLGNCARRQGRFKQANHLYRHALKVCKNYKEAFYNLAASMGRVAKYDLEIEGVVQPFLELEEYVLPEYAGGKEALGKIEEELLEKKKDSNSIRIQELRLEKEVKEQEGDKIAVADIEEELDQLNTSIILETKDVIDYLGHEVAKELKNLSDENRLQVENMLFNLTILGISGGDLKNASDALKTLRELGSRIEYVPMLQAILLDLKGKTEKAIDIFIKLLGKNKYNRYYNVNIGLLYKKKKNRLLALKYLLIGAVLLERSNGLYHLSDLIQLAHQYYEAGSFKKALKLYKVILIEKKELQVMLNMGEIYILRGAFDDATRLYRMVLKDDPDNQKAREKLDWLHQHFCNIAEEFFAKSVFQTAAGKFEHALSICRKPATLKRTADIYKILKQQKKADALMAEYNALMEEEKNREKEKTRQAYIVKGKAFMKSKNYNRAIENFELAFRMKLDKDIFMFLATLYKSLKRSEEMESLLKRWNNMVEYEEKMKRYRREEERKRTQQQEEESE